MKPSLLFCLCLAAACHPPAARAQSAATHQMRADALIDRQSVDTATSIVDGQPGTAGALEGQIDVLWSTAPGSRDIVTSNFQLAWSGREGTWLRDSQIGVSVPLTLGLGTVPGNGDLNAFWQHRWRAQSGRLPTLATLAQLRVPTGTHSSGVDGTFTGILARDAGRATLFANASVTVASGRIIEPLRKVQASGLLGCKWRLTDGAAITANYVHRAAVALGDADQNLLEFGAQVQWSGWSLGPGVGVGLDRNDETPALSAGVTIVRAF